MDDHPLVREWLAALINQQPDLEVCGEAASRTGTLQLLPAAKPDIAIIDISLENESGLDLIKDIGATHPDVRVIVLSMYDEFLYAERALRARGLEFSPPSGFSDIGGTARFRDPSGHTFCLYQPSAESLTWGSAGKVLDLMTGGGAGHRI